MKKSFILIITFSVVMMSCGILKKMTPAPDARPPVAESEQIEVIEESFAFEREEDETGHDSNRFFVILGSFRVNDNASRFKARLTGEGFEPVILLSETGLNRVCVDSYLSEADARQRVLQIRRSSPDYHDSWLLIRR